MSINITEKSPEFACADLERGLGEGVPLYSLEKSGVVNSHCKLLNVVLGHPLFIKTWHIYSDIYAFYTMLYNHYCIVFIIM